MRGAIRSITIDRLVLHGNLSPAEAEGLRLAVEREIAGRLDGSPARLVAPATPAPMAADASHIAAVVAAALPRPAAPCRRSRRG